MEPHKVGMENFTFISLSHVNSKGCETGTALLQYSPS